MIRRWLAPLLVLSVFVLVSCSVSYNSVDMALRAYTGGNISILQEEDFGGERIVLFKQGSALFSALLVQQGFKWVILNCSPSSNLDIGPLTFFRQNLGLVEEASYTRAKYHVVFGEVKDTSLNWVVVKLEGEQEAPVRADVANHTWMAVYDMADWRRDLKPVSLSAGAENGSTAFSWKEF